MKRLPFRTIPPGLVARVERTVSFNLLDPMGVVYHGRYADLFEEARMALLERLGWGYGRMRAEGVLFPVGELAVRYLAPAHYGDRLVLRAGALEYTERLVLAYDVLRIEADGTLSTLTRAETTQLAVDAATGATLWRLPEAMRAAFEAAAQLPESDSASAS